MAHSQNHNISKREIIDLTDDSEPPSKVPRTSSNDKRRVEPPPILPPGQHKLSRASPYDLKNQSGPLTDVLTPALNARDHPSHSSKSQDYVHPPIEPNFTQVINDNTEDGAENELMPSTQAIDQQGFGFTQVGLIGMLYNFIQSLY